MTFSALKHAAVPTAAPLGPALFLAILSLWVFTETTIFRSIITPTSGVKFCN